MSSGSVDLLDYYISRNCLLNEGEVEKGVLCL
jgi:hypothetical protein